MSQENYVTVSFHFDDASRVKGERLKGRDTWVVCVGGGSHGLTLFITDPQAARALSEELRIVAEEIEESRLSLASRKEGETK